MPLKASFIRSTSWSTPFKNFRPRIDPRLKNPPLKTSVMLPLNPGGFEPNVNNSQLTVKPLLEASQREDEIALWLLENVDSLPTAVKEVFSHYSLLLHALAVSQSKLRSVLVQLRRALGITASSEKRKGSGDPIDATAKPGDDKPKDPKEQLRLAVLRCKDLEAWHKRLAKKLRKKLTIWRMHS